VTACNPEVRVDINMLLEVNKLSIGFNKKNIINNLVRDVSFSIPSGQVLGLVGESGSGKTLIASALSGLIPPPLTRTGGKILYQGREIKFEHAHQDDDDPRGRGIFLLFQSPLAALNPTLKIGRQIGETLKEHFKLDRKTAMNQVAFLLESVGIPANKSDSYPYELSGGMRQRVLIALALGLKPGLLIADEPFTGLDAMHEKEILDLLERLHLEGMSILIISHDLRLIADWADRVAVLVEGALVEETAGHDLIRTARHPYTRSLVENMVRLEKALEPPTAD
jgi:ABC-type dipeptide/oligopeptide/nickel transport system ATPase component